MSDVKARKFQVDRVGIAGAVAVVLTLALTSPGVRIAQAAEPAPLTVSADGDSLATIDPALVRRIEGPRPGTCSAGAQAVLPAEAVAHQLSVMIEHEARRLADLMPPTEADAGFVALNSRGYNYPRRPVSD
jgi:hypothetical protein